MRAALALVLLIVFEVTVCSVRDEKLVAGRWTRSHNQPAEELSIVISFHQRNTKILEEFFWEVSNPQSPLYGQYKTADELGLIIGQPKHQIDHVIQTLVQKGISYCDIYRTRDAIRCYGSRSAIEQIFDVKIQSFGCIFTGRQIYRSLKPYTVPLEIKNLVNIIHGISDFSPLSLTHKFGKLAESFMKSQEENLREFVPVPEAPVYISVRSRTLNNILVELVPPCTSSNEEQSNSVCSNNPVVSASGYLSPALDTMMVSNVPFSSSVDCSLVSIYGDISYCSFNIVNVPEYVPWMVNYQLQYQNGQNSSMYTYPYFSVSTPQLLVQGVQDMYSIPKGIRVTNKNATQCVAEFEQQYYSPSDLSLFFELNGLEDYSDLVTLIGPNHDGNLPGTEGNLDIQWIMGIAPGSPTIYWSNAANSTIEIDHILTWQYEMGNMTNPPLVSSVSYAMTESTANNYLGAGYIQQSNTQFQVLASMGLTMIFSAGDAGANSLSAPPMGQLHCFPSHAMWPAESPYITALSATYFSPLTEPICYLSSSEGGINCLNNPLGEVAVGIDYGMFWTTGGGFSNVSAQAPYQTQAVTQYLSTATLPPSNYFNAGGRGYPDVATVGHNLEIVLDGATRVLDGTSASAPVFAGMVTLLNDLRMRYGESPLGFINPLLYQLAQSYPGSFRDVAVGSNACGGFGPPVCCANGFNAAPGWDPVSGLGSPNFMILYNAIESYT